MRLVLQRVKRASVKGKSKSSCKIGRGYLLYVAVGQDDNEEDILIIVNKLSKLRFFPKAGKIHDFQLSISNIKGSILVIPNYTLYGDLNDGNRPYFGEAAEQNVALGLYKLFLKRLKKACGKEVTVYSGTFGGFMEVTATNDGPATLVLETGLIDHMEGEKETEETDDDYAESFDDMLDKLGVDLDNI